MTTLEKLTREDGVMGNVRIIENCMVGITQTLANAGIELRKAQGDLYLWKQMADWLAKHVHGASDEDRKVLAMYEKLKATTK